MPMNVLRSLNLELLISLSLKPKHKKINKLRRSLPEIAKKQKNNNKVNNPSTKQNSKVGWKEMSLLIWYIPNCPILIRSELSDQASADLFNKTANLSYLLARAIQPTTRKRWRNLGQSLFEIGRYSFMQLCRQSNVYFQTTGVKLMYTVFLMKL